MNINELCRVLKYIYKEEYRSDYIDDAADLLLQQQAAVETLQYLLEVAQEDFKTMNSRFVIEHVKQALKELGHE